jgi:AAA+ ATPase superfamily predicted ATPase
MGKRNKVGPPVSGEDFFDRPQEIKKIMRALKSDHHILISSPRRVGKTSILFKLADMGEEDFYFLYVITQSINSESDFYKRLYWAVVDCDSLSSNTMRITAKAKSFLKKTMDKVKSIKGIDLAPGKDQDFKDLFIKVLKSVSLEGSKIVVMIDEFTQTIENIIRKEGEDQAIELLQSIREIRHDDAIRNNVLFILTG